MVSLKVVVYGLLGGAAIGSVLGIVVGYLKMKLYIDLFCS